MAQNGTLFLFHKVPWYQFSLMFIKLPFQYQLLQKLNFCGYGYCLENTFNLSFSITAGIKMDSPVSLTSN